MTKTQERTGITNKNNEQVEMTMTIAEQTVPVTVDPVALRQQKVFTSYRRTNNEDNMQSPLNKNRGNRPLVCQFQQDKSSCQKNSKGSKS